MTVGKLKPLTKHKVVTILESNGFKKVKSGKHITFKKKDSSDDRVLTTWVPHHHEITVHVIRYIIKQSKKPIEEFY